MNNEIEVIHDKEINRFYVTIEKKAAQLIYDVSNNIMNLFYIYIPHKLLRKGIDAMLIIQGIKYAKIYGFQLHSSCAYIKYLLKKYQEKDKRYI